MLRFLYTAGTATAGTAEDAEDAEEGRETATARTDGRGNGSSRAAPNFGGDDKGSRPIGAAHTSPGCPQAPRETGTPATRPRPEGALQRGTEHRGGTASPVAPLQGAGFRGCAETQGCALGWYGCPCRAALLQSGTPSERRPDTPPSPQGSLSIGPARLFRKSCSGWRASSSGSPPCIVSRLTSTSAACGSRTLRSATPAWWRM